MNFTSFANNANCTSLPNWSYSDIMEELKSVYCLDHINQTSSEAQDYCLCFCHQDFSTSYPNLYKNDYPSTASDMKAVQKKIQTNLSKSDTNSIRQAQMLNEKLTPTKRKRNTKELDIRQGLLDLKMRILNQCVTGFTSTPKKAKSAHKKHLRRRSKYIGVSKNNSNWQALINVDQVKKYIGTFAEELGAARAYDMHSVALSGEEASLNFNYSAEEMLERIEYYLTHNSAKIDS